MELERNEAFSISAKTYTLKPNKQNQENNGAILGSNNRYIIPIYQRPYSWEDREVRKFLSDIFTSYWGIEGNMNEEPMFIGTMQLSDKKNGSEQDIIDGQQRITTFLILLKVLKHKFLNCEELKETNLNWLSTRVNNGTQQTCLDEVLNGNLIYNNETKNPYLKNAFSIIEIIDEQIKDEVGNSIKFEIDIFIKYLFEKIYFVVIETRAGLSKTIQIFNAINTTGLDLNGGDIFKIKMYEYLRLKGLDESSFDEISRLYEKIDKRNANLVNGKINITNILNIYQYILIAKYNLPNILYSFGTDTFFERLFDTIFNINPSEHFKNNIIEIELSLEDIERIIDIRYEWENELKNKNNLTAEDTCAINFIWQSRYSRYWILVFVFLYKFKDEENYWVKMLLFTRQLSKLYSVYSVRFLKSINEIHTFTYSLIKTIVSKSSDEVIYTINLKIGKADLNFENILTGNIADNAKIKNIICRLSAMLDEDYKTNIKKEIEVIENKLFYIKIDIEHIQSYHDRNGNKRKDIWDEWKDNINSIGNLMVLEQKINRSISNNPYDIKIKSYSLSSFSIVKQQQMNYPNWDLAKCRERKIKEKEKIINYLFN